MRKQRTICTTELLTKFADLQKLNNVHRSPIIKSSTRGPDLEKCMKMLADIYQSSTSIDEEELMENWDDYMEPFQKEEIISAIKCMPKGKAADRQGVLLEMLLFAGDEIIDHLTNLYNQILRGAMIPETWREACFILLHKGGDVDDPNNWRPIALLKITYTIFARTIFNRIREILDAQQSEEQFGFQRHRST